MAIPHRARRSRRLAILGLVALVLGTLDPLEGSTLILIGCAVVSVAAAVGHSRQARLAWAALLLVLAGVAALWGMSALGGIGGQTGRSLWWGLLFLPYPVGWVLGLFGAIRLIREASATAAPQPAP